MDANLRFPWQLNDLGVQSLTRFQRLGRMADLEQSIIYLRGALELRPPGHRDRSASPNNLAGALSTRFGQLGQIADLEQSIVYHRDDLELCPPWHPDRSGTLSNLGNALSTRFQQLGQLADLEQTITYQRDALELCPPGHPGRSSSLNNLAIALNTRFEPFRSAFELQDGPLSLSDLIHARLPKADFAFLAACDSANSGGTTDTPDESLHVAAAMQFCGIRSVVGTLWPMDDVDGPRVAAVFYQHMFEESNSRKSAEALHKVVSAMRNKIGLWENAMAEGELV